MATYTQQDRQRAVTQMLASWALEEDAPEPDPDFLALLDRYISGELTLAQIRAETNKKFGFKEKNEHKG